MENSDWNLEDKKIIIIQGNNKVDGEINDGKVTFIEKNEYDNRNSRNDFPHYMYMNSFLDNHYLDKKDIQKFSKTNNINIINFFITRNGDIICDEVSYPKRKSMLICMPDKVTEKQKEKLKVLQEELAKDKYKICLLYEFRIKNGIIESKNKFGNHELLEDFIMQEKSR